jgi:uncharacterized protein
MGSRNAIMNPRIERLFIPGAAGHLESILELDPSSHPHLAAVVCHPHPQYGGTMHNKVVFRAAKAALRAGVPALRFNFRGVGESGGTYGGGIGERDDVRAALDYLQSRFPKTPLCVVGFSFGAWVGLTVGAADPRVGALVGLGLPVASYDLGFLREVSKPKLFVQGTLDEFGPADQMQTLYDSLPEPKQIYWVQGVDHFFAGKLEEVQTAVQEFLQGIVS